MWSLRCIHKKLVLANGAADVFPNIPGYENWRPVALHVSRMARRFTERVTFYTPGANELAEQLKLELKKGKDGRARLVTMNNQAISNMARRPARESEVVLTGRGSD
ncbi:hypothetical protein EsH8_II_001081 [Colletotrichum jinshuiense]